MLSYVDNVPWEPETTMAWELRRAGYQTAIVGRDMHQYRPDAYYGFEYAVGTHEYCAHLDRNQARKGLRYGYTGHGINANAWTARPWHLPEELHFTYWAASEAERFLSTRDTTRPFFLVVSFCDPHPPLTPPVFYMDRYLRQGLPEPAIGDWEEPPVNGGLGAKVHSAHVHLKGETLRSCLAGYYGSINYVDDQIQRVLDWGNTCPSGVGETIQVFTSDHGEMLGDHYMWRKRMPYEGATRIPLLISAPTSYGFKTSQVREEAVALEDIMPTLLDMVGCDIPDSVEGRSLVPLLRGDPSSDWQRPWLHGEHGGPWRKYHYLTDGKEKYIWWSDTGLEQLFDLVSDPGELKDLAQQPECEARVAAWRPRMIKQLDGRPEGFTDGEKLIPGREHVPVPRPAGSRSTD
jgi:arylsulfatase A-like enzyme